MTTPTPTDPLIGTTVSQYEIVAKLGGGGMGVVYKARDAKLGRWVALKFLPPQWSHDEGAKQRFMREAQAASATNHRNICVIHNIEETADGRLFIVMAYYEGETLKQRLERGPLPIAETIEIGSEIAEGLARAHAQSVVHRDVKPGNLMLTDDGVKILDFGLAKFADALQLTVPGSTIGTVAYMSPEQARGDEADARSDVWALGVVLYEMLAGSLPFRGTHQEATFHAIKHEPVPSLHAARPDTPEALERIVMKALEKDPEKRFQTAREPARDLRLLAGRTVPLELRTEEIRTVAAFPREPVVRRPWLRRVVTPMRATGAAAILLILTAVGYWAVRPAARVAVAVSPVINQTGFPDLDPYRLALTYALLSELSESGLVRVLPYDRVHQIVEGARARGLDFTSRETLQDIATRSDARFLIVPTLLYQNNAWLARAELRDAETATTVAVYETTPIVSALGKDRAYDLMTALAMNVENHFDASRSRLARLLDSIRHLTGPARPRMAPRFHTLDAAAAFEAGLAAFDELRYADARRSFASASERDPQSALAFAWLAHVAQILQQSNAARQASDQATKLVTSATPTVDALFSAAVAAETRRDYEAAEESYRKLIAYRRDEPAWLMLLGSFQYRRTSWAPAVATFREALNGDPGLVRAHLELCRTYNRLNESASAKQEGDAALAGYRSISNTSGEGQALMCLTDMLRLGTSEQRADAERNSESAVRLFRERQDGFNLARAHYYVALASEARGRLADAMDAYERSLNVARESENVLLEPLVLMNTGAVSLRLGHYSRALDYYQQSKAAFERVGDEQRAAQNQANVSAILIEFAGKTAEGLRDLQNARAVFERLQDKNWQLFAAKVAAASARYAGDYSTAEQELNRAVALARSWDMVREVPGLTIDIALSRLEVNDYASARRLLTEALAGAAGERKAYAQIALALVDIGLGRLDTAGEALRAAASGIDESGATELQPEWHLASGEHAVASNRPADARRHLAAASALWVDDLPNPASVLARAQLGLLDALEGRASGRAAAASSLAKARAIGWLSLIARCRIAAGRVAIIERRYAEAAGVLAVTDNDKALGPELQAQLHYWHGEARAAQGDREESISDKGLARQLVDQLTASLPDDYRSGFGAKPSILAIRQ